MLDYPETHAYFKKSAFSLSGVMFILLGTFFVFNCNNESKNQSKIGSSMPRGEVLVIQNRCFNCHQKNKSSSGPAYSEVSKKYSKQELNRLIETVSKGGSGIWGNVMMPPHPNISIKEIDTMVHWILAGDY